MEHTSTKTFTSLTSGPTFRPSNRNKKYQKQSVWQPYSRMLLVFALVLGNAFYSLAQATYPTMARFAKPSPEPAAPGDAFTPPMSGTAPALAPQGAEWTRSAGPDESIVLTGVNLSRHAGTDEGKDSRFLVFGRGGVQKEARIQRVETDKAIITLPKDLPSWSMYLIWPGNEAGYGQPIAINQTDAWWVGPDKATQGQTISVFGRNLAQNNDTLRSYVYIKPVGSAGQWATVTQVNPYKVDFTVPAGLGNGEYEVWVHNGHGGQYGWSGPQKLTVYNGPQWTNTIFNVKNYGATGNGYTDDTDAIRKAMLAARSSLGATVYFPAGVYMMSNNLQAYSNMQLKGDGPDKSVLKCAANYSSSAMSLIFGSVQTFAITDLGFDGNNNFRGTLDKPIFLRGSTDIWITNARFAFAGYNVMDLHSCRYVFLNKTEHIGISSFLGDCSQLFIDRNNIKMTNDSDMALHSWSGSGISMTRTTARDLDNSNLYSGAGWGKGRVFTGNGTWGSNRNTYLGNNVTYDLTPRPAADVDQNSGEQFLWEGNLGQWAGYASSSTDITTSVPGYSITAQNKLYAVIVKGKGIGQSRRVVANNGGNITLNEPWNVIPDASSYIVIGHFIDRIAVYNNYLDGKPRAVTNPDHIAAAGIEPFGGAMNFIAANNTLHELRQGVANWSTQHATGLDPNFFSMYTNNKMVNCRWGIYNQLILTRPEGTAVLGTTYRKNDIQGAAVAGIHTSVSTSANNSLNADVFEFNSLSNLPQGLSSSSTGIMNQFFYKNNFNAIGGYGLTITPKMALRENTYQGVSALYKGGLQGTTVEAPLHVIDMAGTAGGGLVKTDFTLKNSTIAAMNWVATSNASWLTIGTSSGTIPDERCTSLVELVANPIGLTVGTHTATITVTVGDQIKKYTVSLKLTTPQNGVTITAPAANNVFSTGEQITITANATDQNAGVTKVEFFNGTIKLGEDLTSPYSFTWSNAPAGTFNLTAKSTNSAGASTTSAAVIITVSENKAPTVNITSPLTATTFAAPASITINANATDTDGTISKVEFFNGTIKLGEDVTSPYSFNWYNVAIGSYVITAKATDNAGAVTTSAPAITTVLVNTTPSVAITAPGNNAQIKAPTNVYILANAELTNGNISKVEFFNGATKIGEKTVAPYEMYWMNPATGTYTITAKAIGNTGTTTTSAPVTITVVNSATLINTAPSVSIASPGSTTNFTAPANININANAADIDGMVTKVEFFYGTIKLGEDVTSPFSFTWTNVPAGSYALTARATDNTGTTVTSAPVNIAVKTSNTTSNALPIVAITSPSTGAAFTAPSTITLSANATDNDGTISKVEFFNGSVKLGEDVTSPYSFTWNNVAAGNYTVSARATDNTGAIATSAGINLVVNAAAAPVAPTVTLTSPTTNTSFTAQANITLAANATDADGTVVKVEFYNGATKLGEVVTSPYNFTWSNVPAGSYTLTAKAYDNAGLTTTSNIVTLQVNAPVIPVAPTVSITSPVTGTSLVAPANLTITANAADTDGSVSKVTFFNGGVKLGEDLTSPYTFSWANVAAGNYTITAVATDNAGLTTTSAAVQVTVKAPVLVAPTVNITSPLTAATYTAPASIIINANATDNDGTISKVEFFNGTVKLGEDVTSPYSFTWNNVAAGNYTLTAKATDNNGLTADAAGVNVVVKAPVIPLAPTVAVTSPSSGATFTAPATITLTANAADTDGTVTKVEFYNGTTKLGEDATAPYAFTWTNVAAGSYVITAKAIDNTGLVTTSAAVNITAKALAAPSVAITSPLNAAVLQAPATVNIAANASDVDGSVVKVEFYNGATKIGEDLTSPYNFTWSNVSAGTYTLTAKATDNNGLFTTSAPVTITVKAPAAPTVALTSPTTNTSFTAPANITLAANATDTDGTIIKVEFYNGTTKLGEDVTSPYNFTWSNVPAGSYTLTAKAYDNTGLSSTSAAININVVANNAPNFTINITSPLAGTQYKGTTNILINTSISSAIGTIKKVEFYNGNVKIGEDLTNPFSFTWNNLTAGTYTLTAKATNKAGQSATSQPVVVTVNTGLVNGIISPIVDSNYKTATGGISWQYWNNVPGWYGPGQLPVNNTPTGSKILTSFAAPVNMGDNYGTRIRGYVIPPTTGEYVFYIAGDDQADLYLSTSADPNQKKMIAYLSRPTAANKFTDHASQQSKTVTLQAGKRYYIEALHKEGTGLDHVSVGWKLPNGTLQGPIAGTYLAPFETGLNIVATSNQSAEQLSASVNTAQVSAYPNPAQSRTTIEFTLVQNEDYKIQIFDLKGNLIKTLQSGKAKANEAVKVTWEVGNLPKGIYNATVTTNSQVKTTRIVIQ
ncbi:Ig-like domain-containing protein [Adhaeribacter rhizoryzae]|uniref:T9SS type A sorting domain-containing protein n=1 Tax=Adhaeribacter rhizoryzae TaxID=2607907 RepID=A0A5M6DMJ3_9BACT|nr:Ig-like domain-containing protein [Adhaeribacter rhizoryzae]KAA5548768.1 T9SS type A sorting domain-containing protein [Adhaeribacter rhizoryzae]